MCDVLEAVHVACLSDTCTLASIALPTSSDQGIRIMVVDDRVLLLFANMLPHHRLHSIALHSSLSDA